MKRIISYAAIVMLALVFAAPAQAIIKKTAQTGLQFLKADMSARSAGMGGAFVMAGNDATAMFYNPAGIAYVQSGGDAFATMTQWIAGITYNAAGLVYSLGQLGTVGVNVISADYGDDIIGTEVTADGYKETGSLDVSALSVGAVYARRLTDKFILGGQVRYAYQHLGSSTIPTATAGVNEEIENKVTGLAYEIGTIFYPGLFNSLRLGMGVKNFSPQFKYQDEAFQLPLTFVMGFAVDVFDVLGMGGSNSLLVALDAIHPRDYTERIHLGAEFLFLDMVALRGGYKFNYDIESFSLGGGVKLALGGFALKVDAAYSIIEDFDNVMRFTVGASF
ncbi:hypothetical protein ES703_65730 [subsurface metagenome]|nr:PorV/PorQ family protein [Dehalococcoidia bacterium]